ncbi:MAG: 50S ribosomal protein L36 [Mycoplasma sp.]|nr:50S ribosomal protein L36 [Mycoplasma sp.]
MKVKSSIKPICKDCQLIKRRNTLRIICHIAKHKQRQG